MPLPFAGPLPVPVPVPSPGFVDFAGPALLGLALSAGAFAGIAAYALRRASLESGESQFVLIERARRQLQSTAERARERWHNGEVRRIWNRQRSKGLRLVAATLIGETAIILGMATGSKSLLGPGATAFAVTVMVVSCLLANGVLTLLWLAGPPPEGEAWLFPQPVGPQAEPLTLRQLLGGHTAALPPKSE
jgi:hypothetical protein